MSIIPQLQRKLNPVNYQRRTSKKKNLSISVNNYWDWLVYIDDEYLTDWQVLKFQELFMSQTNLLVYQAFVGLGVGSLATTLLLGTRITGGTSIRWWIKMPFTILGMSWYALLQSNQKYENKALTQLVAQPAPHGSYLRNNLKYHFPLWWSSLSQQLADNGYNLPEMDQYDLKTDMPKSAKYFDASRF